MSILAFVPGHRNIVALDHASMLLKHALRRSLVLLLVLSPAGCAERGPGNVRVVAPSTPATLVYTCSSCSKDCVVGHRKQCIEDKVHSLKAKSGGCLVYCIGRPEKGSQQGDWR